jgi:hypothetical protein
VCTPNKYDIVSAWLCCRDIDQLRDAEVSSSRRVSEAEALRSTAVFAQRRAQEKEAAAQRAHDEVCLCLVDDDDAAAAAG